MSKSKPVLDVVPNAVNWVGVSYDAGFEQFGMYEQQITGINTPITLKVEYTGSGIHYKVGTTALMNDGAQTFFDPPSAIGMTAIANNGTFSVSNNDHVSFGADGSSTSSFTVTVRNTSNGNVILDTFTYTYDEGLGPP